MYWVWGPGMGFSSVKVGVAVGRGAFLTHPLLGDWMLISAVNPMESGTLGGWGALVPII